MYIFFTMTRTNSAWTTKTCHDNAIIYWKTRLFLPWAACYVYIFYSHGQRDARKMMGSIDIKRNDPYNMEEMVMPLQEYINDPRAHELVHNGETFQVLVLLNLTACGTSSFFFIQSHYPGYYSHWILGVLPTVLINRLQDWQTTLILRNHMKCVVVCRSIRFLVNMFLKLQR
jgi:hypothetical protein